MFVSLSQIHRVTSTMHDACDGRNVAAVDGESRPGRVGFEEFGLAGDVARSRARCTNRTATKAAGITARADPEGSVPAVAPAAFVVLEPGHCRCGANRGRVAYPPACSRRTTR